MKKKPTYKELEQKIKLLEEQTRSSAGKEQALEMRVEERLKFERLLADLSSIFVNIPVSEVDGEIEGVLRRAGEILGMDRSGFFEYSKEGRQIQLTHTWAAKGIRNISEIFTGNNYLVPEYLPWCTKRLFQEKIVVLSSIQDWPEEAEQDKRTFQSLGVNSGVIIPYFVEGSFLFAITFGATRSDLVWPEELIQRLRLLGEVLSNTILRKKADLELRAAFSEIKILKDRLEKENIVLREEIKSIQKPSEIIGESDAVKKMCRKIEQVAKTNSTVLILGETGSGKELVARAIHDLGSRRERPMITVNCGALPATLVEAELFGREKGAYTGAISKQVGRFETADGSTIFLDEIGELPLDLQVKLLRVLQEGRFERLGSSKTIKVDIRLIAATNRDLEKAMEEGKFRKDLYYRLNVFPIQVPPLRERLEDILPLSWAFIQEFGEAMGKRIETISKSCLEAMRSYSWPGNIRELRNVVERAMIASTGRSLVLEIPKNLNAGSSGDLTLEESERKHILEILAKTNWRIKGEKGAAKILGLDPGTLYSRMKKLGIERPE